MTGSKPSLPPRGENPNVDRWRRQQIFTDAFTGVGAWIHDWAIRKGFWKPGEDRNNGEMIALMHSELSEALEWLRKKSPPGSPLAISDHIPDYLGIEEELADLVIRVMDMAAGRGWRVGDAIIAKMLYNETREYMHGKQF